MTGELGVEWMKRFEKITHLKAQGRRRLLLVDGHQSHCTRGFLEHAQKNNIEVICYPSHSTHIYQGLDVVIFGVLKRAWTKARDEFEKHKSHVNKTNFLEIYSHAHTKALTKDNILAAFHATGIHPLNRHFVSVEAMQPSIETSLYRTIPGNQTNDVQALTKILQTGLYDTVHQTSEAPSEAATQTSSHFASQPPSQTESIIEALQPTQGAYLVKPGTITPASQPPIFNPYLVSPTRNRYHDLLSEEPQTEQERRLQQALCESEARDGARKEQVLEMQATSVLQNLYVRGVQAELYAAANHKKQRGKKVRLNGDGKPKLLTADEFMELTNQKEEEDQALVEAAEHRNNMRYEYHMAREEWEAQEHARKERNRERRIEYQKELEKWSNAQRQAKAEGKGSQGNKPVRKPFGKPIPQPKLADFLREDVENDADTDSEHGSGSEIDSE